MSKIYKVELYYVDIDDEYEDAKHFKIELGDCLHELWGIKDVTEIKESEKFEWDDELLINKVDAGKEDYDVYFKK